MNTQGLIETLSAQMTPVPRHARGVRVLSGILIGCVAALVVIAALGIRPDLRIALHAFSFWIKLAYSVALGIGTASLVIQLSQPTREPLRGLWLLAIPVLILAGCGACELAVTPPERWLAMWLGQSWAICPELVLTLAVPVFIGLLWSFRKLAPTRLRAAGAAAGLAAGAWAAALYSLHCPDDAAIFVLTWYSLGMLLAAAVGALVGPWVLRW